MKSYKQRVEKLIGKTLTNVETLIERGSNANTFLDSLNSLLNIREKLNKKK